MVTAACQIYVFSLHDALPISCREGGGGRVLDRARLRASAHARGPALRLRRADGRRDPRGHPATGRGVLAGASGADEDRKGTRLNSSHMSISYAGVRLKKKLPG